MKKRSFIRGASLALSLVLLLGMLPIAATAEEDSAGFKSAEGLVAGEEYLLVMNTRPYVDGQRPAAADWCVKAQICNEGDGLDMSKPPEDVATGEDCMWRISYGTTTGTVTLWNDAAQKYMNITSTAATLSDTPQNITLTISGNKVKLSAAIDGKTYYLRCTNAGNSSRWHSGTGTNSNQFTLWSIDDSASSTFIRPMREFVSGQEYVLGRTVTDKAGETINCSVVAADKENGLQYGTRPATLEKAADSLWRITELDNGKYTLYSEVRGKYLGLTATEAYLSDTAQELEVSFTDSRSIRIYTVVDGTTYYLRFSNAMECGSGWNSGTNTSSTVFTLYSAQIQETEYDNTDKPPLYSVACFSDLHVDYGIQFYESPIRQATVDAVDYLKNTLGGANVVLVGGDIVSNNDWGAEWTPENLKKSKDTVYYTLLEGSTDSVVLPITGNHDSEPGVTAGGATHSGDWDKYLYDNVGEYDACLRNSESKFNEVICYRYELDGMEFICVNTPYASSGDKSILYLEQVDWVEEQLRQIGKDKTVILTCHYPLSTGLEAIDRMEEMLAEYPNVLYCYGHVHGSDSYYAWYSTSELVCPMGGGTQNANGSWNTSSALTCHMGSMAYYNNIYQGGALSKDEPLVVQFLKIDFYEDHITFRYYNTGVGTADGTSEIASYTVSRDMTDQLSTLMNGFDFTGESIRNKTVDSKPFTVTASGAEYEGTVTYSVVSGPASIDRNTGLVTLDGTEGRVVLGATLSAEGREDVTATCSFTVSGTDVATGDSYKSYAADATVTGSGVTAGEYGGVNYFDFGNGLNGQSVSYKVNVDDAGEYYLGVLYNIGSNTSRALALAVNNGGAQELPFIRNSNVWGNVDGARWSYKIVKASLIEGENILTLIQSGSNKAPMISDITLWRENEWNTAVDCPVLSGDAERVSAESGFEKMGYDIENGSVSWTVTAPTSGKYTVNAAYSAMAGAELMLSANGQNSSVSCVATATTQGNAWGIASLGEVYLTEGENTLTVSSDSPVYVSAVRAELRAPVVTVGIQEGITTNSVRLVGEIDGLEHKAAGFEIKIDYTDKNGVSTSTSEELKPMAVHYAYTSIKEGDGVATPSVEGYYLIVMEITDIPEDAQELIISFRAYTGAKDERIYGETYVYDYVSHEYVGM